MNIILIGFMGSGKTTVAKPLSQLLRFSSIEMDELVCQRTNTANMRELFAKGGEQLLRATEIEVAKECASEQSAVISTGGGVVLNKIIIDYFKGAGGKIIFLNPSFEQIAKRLEGDDSRPLFKDLESARKLYDFRLPLYSNYADLIIDIANHSPDEIAHMIIEKGGKDGL